MISIGQEYKDRLEDAERKLAALLEELATNDRMLRSSVPEEHKGCVSPIGAVQNYIGDLEQRLTAAEQRNADLIELLRDIRESCTLSRLWDARLDAALKPTESEASE